MTQDVVDDGGRTSEQLLLDSLRLRRVKELKSELESRGISTRDAFEKEELVQRLYTAKLCASDATAEKKKKKKKRRHYDDNSNETDETINFETTPLQSSLDKIIVPFQYFSLEASKSVAAT